MKDNQKNPQVQGNQKDNQGKTENKPGSKIPGTLDEKTNNTKEFSDEQGKGKPGEFKGEDPNKLNRNSFTDEQSRSKDQEPRKNDNTTVGDEDEREPRGKEYEDPEHPHEYDTPRADERPEQL